jgi:ABC-type sugar transport system substrate-binding protein
VGGGFTRRDVLKFASLTGGAAALGTFTGCEQRESPQPSSANSGSAKTTNANEEYVWLSANANLPLFTAHDQPAARLAAQELGVKVTIAGPNSVDIPGLVAAIEQTAARRPAGIMIIGWDPSGLVPAIDKAVELGVPTITVDADVPRSKRACFCGTDWNEVGVRQAEAMLKALGERRGKVAMIGLVGLDNMERAFAGFRATLEASGCTVLDKQADKGNQTEATRVTAGIISAHPDLVGIGGFDSESGPGLGQALKEAGKAGKIVATCVDAEAPHLRLVQEGVLTACVGQRRELFTYYGLRVLFDLNHTPVKISRNDKKAGILPVPVNINTGTYTVTKETVEYFI